MTANTELLAFAFLEKRGESECATFHTNAASVPSSATERQQTGLLQQLLVCLIAFLIRLVFCKYFKNENN